MNALGPERHGGYNFALAVPCDLLGGGAGLELLIGYTRLGNLLALLDREEIAETQKHLVWVGRGIA